MPDLLPLRVREALADLHAWAVAWVYPRIFKVYHLDGIDLIDMVSVDEIGALELQSVVRDAMHRLSAAGDYYRLVTSNFTFVAADFERTGKFFHKVPGCILHFGSDYRSNGHWLACRLIWHAYYREHFDEYQATSGLATLRARCYDEAARFVCAFDESEYWIAEIQKWRNGDMYVPPASELP